VMATTETTGSSGYNYINISATQSVYVTLSEQQIDLLTRSYEQLKDSVYGKLVAQTR
jgi:hypothetical protein